MGHNRAGVKRKYKIRRLKKEIERLATKAETPVHAKLPKAATTKSK